MLSKPDLGGGVVLLLHGGQIPRGVYPAVARRRPGVRGARDGHRCRSLPAAAGGACGLARLRRRLQTGGRGGWLRPGPALQGVPTACHLLRAGKGILRRWTAMLRCLPTGVSMQG